MSGPGDLVRRSDLIAFGNVMEASGFDAFANRIRQIAQELPAAPVDYAALPEVQAIVDAAVKAEREACAWTATSSLVGDPREGIPLRFPSGVEVAAAAIRKRGEG